MLGAHSADEISRPQSCRAKRTHLQILGVKLVYVLLAAIATTAVGFLGYSPPLFAKPWMLAMRYDPNDKAGRDEMRKGEGKL
jgi:hypothetical protein